MCRAAGEVADGFQAHPMHSAAYIQEVVRPSLKQGQRNATETRTVIHSHLCCYKKRGRASALAVRQISFYASTPSYRRFLEFHGFQDIGRPLSDLMRRGELDEMPKMVPDALVEIVTLWGNAPSWVRSLKHA